GRDVPVRATIEQIDGLSAHADRTAIVRWLGAFRRPPRMTYVVHGEPSAAAALAEVLRDRLAMPARPALDGECVPLTEAETIGGRT
ncbi:MAG: MBL fold metallo-hydrolase, partial [Planctomycetes bacterium]|nr:MBL fold metallo-hydrolase [Planctomycetota bacterium]